MTIHTVSSILFLTVAVVQVGMGIGYRFAFL